MVEMDELLDLVVTEGCSDLHLEVGVAPVIRLHGEMTQLDLPVLTPEDTEALVKSIASPRHLQQLAEDGVRAILNGETTMEEVLKYT